MILNIFPFFPGRSWKKNAPAPLLAKCSQIVTTRNNGDKHIIAKNESTKPNTRLI
jgi:hypothetical protein